MFNGMPDAVVFADPNRVIRMVNPAFTKVFGYAAEEAIGRTTEFFYADPVDYAEQGRQRLSGDGGAGDEVYELRYLCRPPKSEGLGARVARGS